MIRKSYYLLALSSAIGWGYLCYGYIILGWSLFHIQQYNDLYALLQKPTLELTYLSRLFATWISLGIFDIKQILYQMLYQIHWQEVFCIVSFIAIYPLIEYRKILTCISILMLVLISSGICLLVLGLQANSLAQGIFYLRIMGLLVFGISCMFSIIILYAMIQCINQYCSISFKL